MGTGRHLLAVTPLVFAACERSNTDALVARYESSSGASSWCASMGAPVFGDAVVGLGLVEVPGRALCGQIGYHRFAFDAATGDNRDPTGLAVVDVSGSDTLVVDAEAVEVRMVDSASEEIRWRAEFPCEPKEEGGICTLQWIDAGLAGDLAFVSHNPESSQAILDARARSDGKPLWSITFEGARTASAVHNQPASSGPALVYLNGNGGPDRIVGLDRATGEVQWTVELESSLSAGLLYTQFAPTLSGDVVVFPGCDETSENGCGLVGLDSTTGATLWRFDTSLADRSAVDDSGVYTLSGSDLVALEARTGDVRWRASLQAPAPSFHIAVDGSRVYAVLADGQLLAYDVADGEEVWRSELPADMSTESVVQMVVADGALYVIGRVDISDLVASCSD